MYYGFITNDENAAIGALLVYGIWRSRDMNRLKITPDIWGMVERATKSSAKRAMDLTDFIEKLKGKLKCSSLKPQYMKTDTDVISMHVDPTTGEIIQLEDKGRREFWVNLLEEADDKAVLEKLYTKTSLIIALVRDRLERERALEARGIIKYEEEEEIEDEED